MANKYDYFWIIQGNYGYGYGWEDLSYYDMKEYKYSDVMKDLKEYRLADGAPKRLIERRELAET